MAIRYAFRQGTNFCSRYNSADGYGTNGSDFWDMTSCTVDVEGSTTPHNVRQSTVIHGVAYWKTLFRNGS